MRLLLALLGGCDGDTGTDTDTDRDTGLPCPPVVFFADADGDGHGDPATADAACEPSVGSVAVGDDCDDGAAEVFPGAPERCNGLDDDCDRAPAVDEADGDGDGVRVCDGDCDDEDPDRFPGAPEVCNGGVDDDCDERVDEDDDSVDPTTCATCPDPEAFELGLFDVRTFNPCVLDPTVSMCSTDPKLPDTHSQGLRLHSVVQLADGTPLRDDLLLFLPPGPGTHNRMVMTFAAYAGFRTVSLGWQNEPDVSLCRTSACYEDSRRELLTGEDRSPFFDVWPSDSVVGRLGTLLSFLHTTYPAEGWDRYYDPSSGPRWEHIVVFGWSDGANEGGYIGRDYPVRSSVLVSGPMEWADDDDALAGWLDEPRVQPECLQWGFYHREEPGSGFGTQGPDLFEVALGQVGIEGAPVDADSVATPYGGAKMLNTALTYYTEDWCNPHQSMAMDECMHPDQHLPYLYSFCGAGNERTCP